MNWTLPSLLPLACHLQLFQPTAAGLYSSSDINPANGISFLSNPSGQFTLWSTCSIEATITPDCAGGESINCEPSEGVILTAVKRGNCPATAYVQVDANSTSTNSRCWIAHNDANITGMDIPCNGPQCQVRWTIPDPIPLQCYGQTYAAIAVGLYSNPVPNGWITGGPATGSFTMRKLVGEELGYGWPQFRANFGHAGLTLANGPTQRSDFLYLTSQPGKIYQYIVYNNTIAVYSLGGGVNSKYHIFFFNATSGALITSQTSNTAVASTELFLGYANHSVVALQDQNIMVFNDDGSLRTNGFSGNIQSMFMTLGDLATVFAFNQGKSIGTADINTGVLKWQKQINDYNDETYHLITGGGYIFVSKRMGMYVNVSAFDEETGAYVWQRPPSEGDIMPNVHDVYYYNNTLYILSFVEGNIQVEGYSPEQGFMQTLLAQKIGTLPNFMAEQEHVVFYKNLMIFYTTSDGGRLNALSLNDGSTQWVTPQTYADYHSLLAGSNLLYAVDALTTGQDNGPLRIRMINPQDGSIVDTYASLANYYYVSTSEYKENVKVALNTLYLANGSSMYKMDVACRIDNASINGLCAGGLSPDCEPGEFIQINASLRGVCPNPVFVQVDANASECWFSHSDGNITGMNISCINTSCTETFALPDTIPPACYGKTYNASAAGLYDRDDITPSHWIAGTTNVFGNFTIIETCGIHVVRVLDDCGGGTSSLCEPGENISVRAVYTGLCAGNDYTVQVNLSSADNQCRIYHGAPNGSLEVAGINISCTESPCEKMWTIPSIIPSMCSGRRVNVTGAEFWIGEVGTGQRNMTTTGTGSFRFASPPAVLKTIAPSTFDCHTTVEIVFTIDGSMVFQLFRRPTNIVITHDVSGSMLDDNKLVDAKAAARSFIDRLDPAYDLVGLVNYSSDGTSIMQQMTTNYPLLKTKINSMIARGGTPMGDGVWLALDELQVHSNQSNSKFMILLTDGLHNWGVKTPTEATTRAKQDHVIIYTIGLGPDADQVLLQKIAQNTSGKFFYSPTGPELDEIYQLISEDMVNYDNVTLVLNDFLQGYVLPNVTLPPGCRYVGSDHGIQCNVTNVTVETYQQIRINVTIAHTGNNLTVNVFPDSYLNFTNERNESLIFILPQAFINVSGQCNFCGNNVIEPGEQCDGTDWGNPAPTCMDFDEFIGGTLDCNAPGTPDECIFNTSGCTQDVPTVPLCGNGIVDVGEQCDGNPGDPMPPGYDWGSFTGCWDFDDFVGGNLSCNRPGTIQECIFNTTECGFGTKMMTMKCGKVFFNNTITPALQTVTCNDTLYHNPDVYAGCINSDDCLYIDELNGSWGTFECYPNGAMRKNVAGEWMVCHGRVQSATPPFPLQSIIPGARCTSRIFLIMILASSMARWLIQEICQSFCILDLKRIAA
jgi:uncharacterized protein YegL